MNVALRLVKRESGVRCSRFYVQVPPRLQTPIKDILDEAQEIKSCILLGFTRDGGHLVSYTSTPVAAADGKEGYCLQLWSFDRGAPCRKLCNVPLFRTDSSLEQPEDEDEFALVSGALSVTVAETPGGEFLVVHGRPTEVDELPGDRLVNHLTIIPGPRHIATAQQLQVAHLSYHTAPPHPPFNPFSCILLQPSLETGPLSTCLPAVYVACNLGDGLRLVRLAVLTPFLVPPLHRKEGLEQQQEQGAQPEQAWGQGRVAPQHPQQHHGPGVWEQQRQQQQQHEGQEQRLVQSSCPMQQLSCLPQERSSSPLPLSADPEPGGSKSPEQEPGFWIGGEAEQQRPRQLHLRQQHPGGGAAQAGSGSAPPWSEGTEPRSSSGGGGDHSSRHGNSAMVTAAELGQLRTELNLRTDTVVCWTGRPRSPSYQSSNPCPPGCPEHAGAGALMAATSVWPAGRALDWEEFIFGAVREQELPPQGLQDYGTALVAPGSWCGQAGLLAVALLRLRGGGQGQDEPAWQCLLVHVAAGTGATQVVEVLGAPFPWQEDFARLLQRAGVSGAGMALDRVAAFVAEWLRYQHSVPSSRQQLPHVLTNRSVLVEGRSLKYIAHTWLPQCIMGYQSQGASQAGSGEGE